MRAERRTWQETREGAYLLRTNLPAESAAELWTKCIQLTEAEAAFRALKNELSISINSSTESRHTSWWPFSATRCG